VDPSKLTRGAIGTALAIALVATLAWAALTFAARPLDGVEGDVLFEADRVRSGLALYVDPAVGAHDYGPVPARWLVLYPPLWSGFLSLMPKGAAPFVARGIGALAWIGVAIAIVLGAPRERRVVVAYGAAFVLGLYVLMIYGASGRPDAIAVAASGFALERAARRGQLDAVCGALFAIAAWTKPNVIGAAPGAFVAAVLASRRTGLLAAAGAAVLVSAGIAGVLTGLVGGEWITHLLRSTGQEPSGTQWIGQMISRGPFFALPLGAAIAVGWRSRRDPGAAIATGALVTSTVWCVVSLAKIGSASNYFMEPCVAALVVLARADLPKLAPRVVLGGAAVALAQIAWDGVASVRSALEAIPRAREQREVLASVREKCGATANDVVIADEPGLELMIDGRIVATPFQSTHLARRGKFPIEKWIEDVSRPQVRCVVMQDDLLDHPLDRVDPEHDRFGPELRQALVSQMEKSDERAGLAIWRRRY
jgi:hypothetical protein